MRDRLADRRMHRGLRKHYEADERPGSALDHGRDLLIRHLDLELAAVRERCERLEVENACLRNIDGACNVCH